MVVLALAVEASPARAQSLEYVVKANYLVRFAAFTDWPPSAFDTPGAPLNICIAGHDPFGEALDQAAAGQTAHGRRIAVRRLGDRTTFDDCQIVFLGRTATGAPEATAPVLVVTDSALSTRAGMIQFVIANNRVRFNIDQAAAGRARLAMSSRLLNLAVRVREGG
jgi:hypothetical protein